MPVGALLIDFNGTLSDDEHRMFEIYVELFAERGVGLDWAEYVDRFLGRSDEAVFSEVFGPAAARDLVEQRIDRYVAHADGATIDEEAREAVRRAAASVPVVVVTSAFRREVAPVLSAAGLDGIVTALVSADDVAALKPDPELYRTACARVGVDTAAAVAIEDTAAGIASARGAGVPVVAVATTAPRATLADAERIYERVTVELVRELLAR